MCAPACFTFFKNLRLYGFVLYGHVVLILIKKIKKNCRNLERAILIVESWLFTCVMMDIWVSAQTCIFFSKQMATLSDVHQKELDSMSMLRISNESKCQSSPSCLAPTVCLCHTVPAGPMLQCELCRDAYHSGCVPGFKDIQTGLPWLCPLCKRSEKPPLDKVLPLLASLQRIRIRLPEGDALRYVIERTVRWQHKVQQVSPPTQHLNGKVSVIFFYIIRL